MPRPLLVNFHHSGRIHDRRTGRSEMDIDSWLVAPSMQIRSSLSSARKRSIESREWHAIETTLPGGARARDQSRFHDGGVSLMSLQTDSQANQFLRDAPPRAPDCGPNRLDNRRFAVDARHCQLSVHSLAQPLVDPSDLRRESPASKRSLPDGSCFAQLGVWT